MVAALLRIVHVAPLRDVSRLVDLQGDAHDRRDRVRRNLLLDGNLLDRGGHARHKDPDHRAVECGGVTSDCAKTAPVPASRANNIDNKRFFITL